MVQVHHRSPTISSPVAAPAAERRLTRPPHRPGHWSELGLLESEVEEAEGHAAGTPQMWDLTGRQGAGRSIPQPAEWVSAAPFRAHLLRLIQTTGLPWRTIAVLAAVPSVTVDHLLHGRNGRRLTRLQPHLAARLLAMTPASVAEAEHCFQDSTEAGRLIQLLQQRGWTPDELSRRCGICAPMLEALLEQRVDSCTQLSVATLKALAQALWQLPAPDVSHGIVPTRSTGALPVAA